MRAIISYLFVWESGLYFSLDDSKLEERVSFSKVQVLPYKRTYILYSLNFTTIAVRNVLFHKVRSTRTYYYNTEHTMGKNYTQAKDFYLFEKTDSSKKVIILFQIFNHTAINTNTIRKLFFFNQKNYIFFDTIENN